MIICFYFFRELRDIRQRFDAVLLDVKRKDATIKEMQSRLESGEGCKYSF